MISQKTINLIHNYSFSFELNFNDVFFPGSYSEYISAFDLYKISPLIELHEEQAIFAYESIVLGVNPFDKFIKKGFYESKNEILKLLNNKELPDLEELLFNNKQKEATHE